LARLPYGIGMGAPSYRDEITPAGRRSTPCPPFEVPVLLVVHASAEVRASMRRALRGLTTGVVEAEGPLEARAVLAATPSLRAVVADEDLASAGDGVELLERIRSGYQRVRRVLLTSAAGHYASAVSEGRLDAVVPRPWRGDIRPLIAPLLG
jgi:CheY-like chemotaxis protein